MCGACLLQAQKHDNIWMLGYGGGGQSGLNDSFGISILRFDYQNHFSIENNQTCDMNFWGGNSSMCDSVGNLLFFSNAEKIYNANYALMANGNNLNGTNQRQPQGVISLPFPQHPNLFMVLISEIKYFSAAVGYAGYKTYKNVVEMGETAGQTNVLEKKIEIINDTLEYGQLVATKHANGLDWWILVPAAYTNQYYTMLLDSSGISIVDTQACGAVFRDGLGQAVFSPNGMKYARVVGITTTTPNHLYIYDFDRCTGKLSNPLHLEYENWGFGNGCAISPNSRFLYALNANYVFQYDLKAIDIAASKTLVAEWDGYVHEVSFATTFAAAQLAPDGKIYIATAFSAPFLHVIEYPDRKGLACQVHQRAVHLPNYNNYSVPNHPNYRLGPIDGSACDTLGFNNHPLCNWRWEQEDTLSPLQVTFTDLSAYEPAEWHWDFGDPNSGGAANISQDTNPVHVFSKEGIYNVCLMVSNQYSVDTFCQVVNLGISSSEEAVGEVTGLSIYPNPANQSITVSGFIPNELEKTFEIYTTTGQKVLEVLVKASQTSIDISTAGLRNGLYIYRSNARDKSIFAGKIVVLH